MKEKFNVGDKVRIIKNENSSNNKIGDEGIITEIEDFMGTNAYRVEVEDGKNWGNWSAQDEIELIK
jgi:superfamily I DNA and RNA helicase